MDYDDAEMLFGVETPQASSQDSLGHAAQVAWKTYDEPSEDNPAISARHAFLGHDVQLSAKDQVLKSPEDFQRLQNAPSGLLCQVQSSITVNVEGAPALPPGTRDRHWVIARIEDIFEAMSDVLLKERGQFSMTLRSRAPPCKKGLTEHSTFPTGECLKYQTIRFPGRTEQEAWRHTVVVRILELMHEALSVDVTISKRDIYYRHPALFAKQAIVDRYVDDLACTFGVPRSSLNVTAAAKGLVAGAFKIQRGDGTVIDGTADREGLLVPKIESSDQLDVQCAEWILVVEKEATFRSQSSSEFWNTLSSQGILITAKGYPDISTRAFLRALAVPSSQNAFRNPRVYALVDYDPDGLGIMSTYKYGSYSLAHENAALNVSSIRWLGLRSPQPTSADSVHQDHGMLRLSARDRRKASKMLEREVFAEQGPELEWRREVQVMLILNLKAEIQLLEARPGGLVKWLLEELA